ncbi:MAG: RpiB/LacA/LacB family sugar-phosphate isomerase [Spirochaetota bacterium]|jgi:ribose 5-phosphate isomerase RpiB
MKIAVINETSAGDRNADVMAALEGRGHEVINAGMTKTGGQPELTYIHTGLLAALLINAGRVEYVVGGCGTGLGFLNSVVQYPGIVCGLVADPVAAWLFTQINGGNCVSLPMLYQFGWAGDVNFRFIFDRIFSVEPGVGYPAHRQVSQRESRRTLFDISKRTHRSMAEILGTIDDTIVKTVLSFPGVMDTLDLDTLSDGELRSAIKKLV